MFLDRVKCNKVFLNRIKCKEKCFQSRKRGNSLDKWAAEPAPTRSVGPSQKYAVCFFKLHVYRLFLSGCISCHSVSHATVLCKMCSFFRHLLFFTVSCWNEGTKRPEDPKQTTVIYAETVSERWTRQTLNLEHGTWVLSVNAFLIIFPLAQEETGWLSLWWSSSSRINAAQIRAQHERELKISTVIIPETQQQLSEESPVIN